MIRPDFREIKHSELYHYGMPQRSGRYAWGSGDRPYQRLEKKVSKKEAKMEKKFTKADKKISSKQKVANKQFEKATKKANSIFATKRGEKRAFDKAVRSQMKVNRQDYKMSKLFQKYQKQFEKWDVTMSDKLRKKGLGYYTNVVNNSKQAYQIALGRVLG